MGKRNLDLISRNENTRDKFHTEVILFDLDQILKHFTDTVNMIKVQFHIADELIALGKQVEGENIWRSQIVFLASAFDFYMHEITKYGLCKIYEEKWEKTDKYKNLQISMEMIEIALKSGEDIDWFLEYINRYYQVITMVSFDSVKDQFNLLGIDMSAVADGAFYQRDGEEKTKYKLKRRLNELFSRRNIIAHQTDRQHSDAQVLSIEKGIVQDYISDIEKIVKSIDKEVREK